MEHFDPASNTLTHLQTVLAHETSQDKFTCHGSLPIFVHPPDQPYTPSSADTRPFANQLDVRFSDGGELTKLSLPPSGPHDNCKLQRLVDKACSASPSTMYNDLYQEPGLLRPEQFITDFCPYKTGIINAVTQHLVPPMSDGTTESKFRKEDWNHNLSEWMDHHAYLLPPDAQNKIMEGICGVVDWDINITNGYFPLDRVFECMKKIGCGPPPPMKADKGRPQTDDAHARANILASFTEIVGHGHESQVRQWEVFAVATQRTVNQNHARVSTLVTNTKKRLVPRGVCANLAALNVHTGPSGMFKPLTDYPLSDTHIGTLLVTLPVHFQGGGLAVRHNAKEVFHHDQSSHQPEIQWAAFYSGCEHEVLPIQAGHRISLTYDLFLAPPSYIPQGLNLTLSSTHSHLTRHLRQAFMLPAFMSHGGYIGVYLSHVYADGAFNPRMLKGSDVLVYETFLINHLATASLTLPNGTDGQMLPQQLKQIIHTLNEQHAMIYAAVNARTPCAPQDYDSDLDMLIEEDIDERQDYVSAEVELARVAKNVKTAGKQILRDQRSARRKTANEKRARTITWLNDRNSIVSGSSNICPEGYVRLALIAKVPATAHP